MRHKESISFSPYVNETYYMNVSDRHSDGLIHLLTEGILILYKGNIFDLKDYWGYNVDDEGKPI